MNALVLALIVIYLTVLGLLGLLVFSLILDKRVTNVEKAVTQTTSHGTLFFFKEFINYVDTECVDQTNYEKTAYLKNLIKRGRAVLERFQE